MRGRPTRFEAWPARTPDYLDFFTRSAVKYNLNIVGGSQFTLREGRLFNVALPVPARRDHRGAGRSST